MSHCRAHHLEHTPNSQQCKVSEWGHFLKLCGSEGNKMDRYIHPCVIYILFVKKDALIRLWKKIHREWLDWMDGCLWGQGNDFKQISLRRQFEKFQQREGEGLEDVSQELAPASQPQSHPSCGQLTIDAALPAGRNWGQGWQPPRERWRLLKLQIRPFSWW